MSIQKRSVELVISKENFYRYFKKKKELLEQPLPLFYDQGF